MPRDDWRTVAGYLDGRLQESDCILVHPPWQVAPVHYYLRGSFCTVLRESLAAVDVRAIPADRLFVVTRSLDREDIGVLQAATGAFGREVEDRTVRSISEVEYAREP